MTMTIKSLLVAMLFSLTGGFAQAQNSVDLPDIHYDRSELPLSVAVLVERMGKYENDNRAATEKDIASKRASVIASLKKELAAQTKAGNTKGVKAIQKQLAVWKLEADARKNTEMAWVAKRAQQKGAAWKSMLSKEGLELWKKHGLPGSVNLSEKEAQVKSALIAAALYPCGSENVVVRGKIRLDKGGTRPLLEQGGIGFQVNPKQEGGFIFVYQGPEEQNLLYGGFKKSEQEALDTHRTKLPRSEWGAFQIAMVKGAMVCFADGKKVMEYKHPELGTPTSVMLFSNGSDSRFKDLEMLSPTDKEVEGLLAGREVK